MGIDDFSFVGGCAKSAPSLKVGINRLLDYCEKKSPDPVWAAIRNLDFEGEIPRLRAWLQNVLSSEPPSNEINAFWFGLFNPILDDGEPSCGLYVSGSTRFDPDDETGDWASWDDASYLPEDRYADSKVLHEMYRLVTKKEGTSDLGEYALALGYSCLAVKEICRSIDPALLLGDRARRDVAVGFDSGDFIVLEGIEASKETSE